MTFEQLKALFQSYTGIGDTEVEDIELALWFNEAQLELAYDFGEVGSLAVSNTALPADYLNTIKVSNSNGMVGYEITPDGNIISNTDATLYYRKYPTDFTGLDLSAKSALPEAVHYLMAIFAASRYWDKESEGDGEESNHANKWMGYFINGKQNALKKLSLGGAKPKYWTVV